MSIIPQKRGAPQIFADGIPGEARLVGNSANGMALRCKIANGVHGLTPQHQPLRQ